MSNHPPFPDGFDPDLGFAFAGHQVEAFLSDPQRGDWTPKAGSPVAAAGKQEPELRPRAVAAPMPGSGDASVPIPLGNRIGAIQADGTRYAALKPEDWPAGLETTLVG